MRILHITNNYTPYSGGVVSSLNATIPALIERGHDARIVTFDFGTNEQDAEYVFRIKTAAQFWYKQNRMVVPWRVSAQLHRIIQQFEPDILHLHHPFLLGYAGLKLARAARIPTVFTHHSWYHKYLHYLPLPQVITGCWVAARIQRFCNQLDLIITPGKRIQQFLEAQNLSTPVVYQWSGLQSQFVKPYSPPPRATPFQLLCVGRFAPEKNWFALIDLYAQLVQSEYTDSAFRLTCVGYGALEKTLQLYAYHKKKLTPTQVSFVIKPPKHRLSQLYQEADLFVFTSRSETQGLVTAEAMAHSTPVIALAGPGQEDIIQDRVNGLLSPSLNQMAHFILEVKTDQSFHYRLAQGAYKTAQSLYPEKVGANLSALYQQVTQGIIAR